MKNKISDLRNHLFEVMEALKDKDHPMDIARAKAVSEIAQTIINSAKVECDFLALTGGEGTGFIPAPGDEKPVEPSRPRLVK